MVNTTGRASRSGGGEGRDPGVAASGAPPSGPPLRAVDRQRSARARPVLRRALERAPDPGRGHRQVLAGLGGEQPGQRVRPPAPSRSAQSCSERSSTASTSQPTGAGRRPPTKVTPGAVRGGHREPAAGLRLAVRPVAQVRLAAERQLDRLSGLPAPGVGALALARRRPGAPRPRSADGQHRFGAPLQVRARAAPAATGRTPSCLRTACRRQPLPALDQRAGRVADVEVVDVGVAVAAALGARAG